MKSGYWRIVSVCFLTAMLTAAYSISTTFLNLQIPSGSQPADAAYAPSVPNSEVLLDTLRHLLQGTPLSGLFSGTLSDKIVNSKSGCTSSKKVCNASDFQYGGSHKSDCAQNIGM